MTDRDHTTVLPSGEEISGVAPDGTTVTGPRVYRPMHGLRPDHAAALLARPDLCARLWRDGLDPEIHHLAGTPDQPDAAIDAMLREPMP